MQTNFNTKKMSIAIMAALISTSMVFAANAGNRNGKGRGYGDGERGFPMIGKLNLTDAQQKQVAELAKKEKDEISKVRAEMDKLRDQIRALWEKEPVDKNKVKSLHRKMQTAQTKIADAHLNFRLGVYDVLTAEQRKQAAAERKAWHAGREDRRNNASNKGYWNGGQRGDGNGHRNGKGKCGGHGRGEGRGPGFGMGPVW